MLNGKIIPVLYVTTAIVFTEIKSECLLWDESKFTNLLNFFN